MVAHAIVALLRELDWLAEARGEIMREFSAPGSRMTLAERNPLLSANEREVRETIEALDCLRTVKDGAN